MFGAIDAVLDKIKKAKRRRDDEKK